MITTFRLRLQGADQDYIAEFTVPGNHFPRVSEEVQVGTQCYEIARVTWVLDSAVVRVDLLSTTDAPDSLALRRQELEKAGWKITPAT